MGEAGTEHPAQNPKKTTNSEQGGAECGAPAPYPPSPTPNWPAWPRHGPTCRQRFDRPSWRWSRHRPGGRHDQSRRPWAICRRQPRWLAVALPAGMQREPTGPASQGQHLHCSLPNRPNEHGGAAPDRHRRQPIPKRTSCCRPPVDSPRHQAAHPMRQPAACPSPVLPVDRSAGLGPAGNPAGPQRNTGTTRSGTSSPEALAVTVVPPCFNGDGRLFRFLALTQTAACSINIEAEHRGRG